MSDEMAVADAHPSGARPFKRPDYIKKFRTLADGVVAPAEQDRFIVAAERLATLQPGELDQLTFTVETKLLDDRPAHGIFDWRSHQ
jgi:2-methylcitrate dehydratase